MIQQAYLSCHHASLFGDLARLPICFIFLKLHGKAPTLQASAGSLFAFLFQACLSPAGKRCQSSASGAGLSTSVERALISTGSAELRRDFWELISNFRVLAGIPSWMMSLRRVVQGRGISRQDPRGGAGAMRGCSC